MLVVGSSCRCERRHVRECLALAVFLRRRVRDARAGCTWNDIVDRDLDRLVERTRSRPIPSGAVTVTAAAVFLALQLLVGLAVILQFNAFTEVVALSSLGVIAIYPFMKRITYWPQTVLGFAFSWGALMGWPALLGRLEVPALLLYAGSSSG